MFSPSLQYATLCVITQTPLLLPDSNKLNECHYYALKTLWEACDNEEHMRQTRIRMHRISHYVYARQAFISKRKSLT